MSPQTLLHSDTIYQFTYPSHQKPTRLDVVITKQFPSYTRSFLKKVIEKHGITINNRKITKASHLVRPGDHVILHIPKIPLCTPTTDYDFGVTILSQHEHFWVINKPAGLLVHSPSVYSGHPTLVDWILQQDATIADVGAIDRPGIVHRLDKGTSGLMLIPRTNYGHAQLSQLFKNREIHKTYRAVVQGTMPAQGIIDYDIGRDPITRARMTADIPGMKPALRPLYPRHAITYFTTLKNSNVASYVEFKPVTGRTHQIRVHSAAIGHPLLGDPIYGSQHKYIARTALHAYKLAFIFDGKPYEFTAPLPEDFCNLLEKLHLNSTTI